MSEGSEINVGSWPFHVLDCTFHPSIQSNMKLVFDKTESVKSLVSITAKVMDCVGVEPMAVRSFLISTHIPF
jgi:hypothetical protein